MTTERTGAPGFLLELRNATKKFGALRALDDVSMHIDRGEVVGLVGENGAGKSTLVKVLSGIHRLDSGALFVNGVERHLGGPRDAAQAGVGVVHQEQSLLPNLTVAENILLGHEGDAAPFGVFRRRAMHDRAAALLARVGTSVDPRAVTETLSFADRQMVEIAKALAVQRVAGNGSTVICLDEATSVLDKDDIDALYRETQRLRELGGVVFVSHRLDEVLRFSDRVYVLRDGRVVAERDARAVSEVELHQLMVGRDSRAEFYLESRQADDPHPATVFEARGLGDGGAFDDVSFRLGRGEILSIAGVVGSGREELCRALYGAHPVARGAMLLDGRPYRPRSPKAAVGKGIAYIPAERKTEGVIAGLTVAQNLFVTAPQVGSRGVLASRRKRREISREYLAKLRVRPDDPELDIGKLSGGNQQKVVLARCLLLPDLKILILDHPTRGLDVGAKEDLYQIFRDLSDRGIAMILIAESLDEVIGLSNRIIVMRDGRVSATFDSPAGAKPQKVDLVREMV